MSAAAERVVVPLTRCVLCDFEFEAKAFTTVQVGEYHQQITLWVSWCEEHQCVTCPACYGCQAVLPTRDRCAIALERREHSGV